MCRRQGWGGVQGQTPRAGPVRGWGFSWRQQVASGSQGRVLSKVRPMYWIFMLVVEARGWGSRLRLF